MPTFKTEPKQTDAHEADVGVSAPVPASSAPRDASAVVEDGVDPENRGTLSEDDLRSREASVLLALQGSLVEQEPPKTEGLVEQPISLLDPSLADQDALTAAEPIFGEGIQALMMIFNAEPSNSDFDEGEDESEPPLLPTITETIGRTLEAAHHGILPWDQGFFLLSHMKVCERPGIGNDRGSVFLEKPKITTRVLDSDAYHEEGQQEHMNWFDLPPKSPKVRRRLGKVLKVGSGPAMYVEYTALTTVNGAVCEDSEAGSLFQVLECAWLGPGGLQLCARTLGHFEENTAGIAMLSGGDDATSSSHVFANLSCLRPAAPPADMRINADDEEEQPRSRSRGGWHVTALEQICISDHFSSLSPGGNDDAGGSRHELSQAEERALTHGVRAHGEGQWQEIKADSRYNFEQRSASDLKNRWLDMKGKPNFEATSQAHLKQALSSGHYGPRDYLELVKAQTEYHSFRVMETRATAETIAASVKRSFAESKAHSRCALCLRQESEHDPLCGPYRDTQSVVPGW